MRNKNQELGIFFKNLPNFRREAKKPKVKLEKRYTISWLMRKIELGKILWGWSGGFSQDYLGCYVDELVFKRLGRESDLKENIRDYVKSKIKPEIETLPIYNNEGKYVVGHLYRFKNHRKLK